MYWARDEMLGHIIHKSFYKDGSMESNQTSDWDYKDLTIVKIYDSGDMDR